MVVRPGSMLHCYSEQHMKVFFLFLFFFYTSGKCVNIPNWAKVMLTWRGDVLLGLVVMWWTKAFLVSCYLLISGLMAESSCIEPNLI